MKYEEYLDRLIINEDGNIYHFPGKSIVKDTNRYIFSNDIEKDINNIFTIIKITCQIWIGGSVIFFINAI